MLCVFLRAHYSKFEKQPPEEEIPKNVSQSVNHRRLIGIKDNAQISCVLTFNSDPSLLVGDRNFKRLKYKLLLQVFEGAVAKKTCECHSQNCRTSCNG